MNINNIVDNDNEEENYDGHDKDVLAGPGVENDY